MITLLVIYILEFLLIFLKTEATFKIAFLFAIGTTMVTMFLMYRCNEILEYYDIKFPEVQIMKNDGLVLKNRFSGKYLKILDIKETGCFAMATVYSLEEAAVFDDSIKKIVSDEFEVIEITVDITRTLPQEWINIEDEVPIHYQTVFIQNEDTQMKAIWKDEISNGEGGFIELSSLVHIPLVKLWKPMGETT